MKTEIGFVNIHIDIETKKLYISETPYKTIDEAEAGVLIGDNIEKVGIFRIQYTKYEKKTIHKRRSHRNQSAC